MSKMAEEMVLVKMRITVPKYHPSNCDYFNEGAFSSKTEICLEKCDIDYRKCPTRKLAKLLEEKY